MQRNLNGVLLLDKPLHMSSNQALQKVKWLFSAKKAGHTGSLDLLATGLLPICFGEATKFSQFLLDADKYYYVVSKLGASTTTGDLEGEIVETHSTKEITLEAIHAVLKQFDGEIDQIPSMFSALKHKGQPLYKLARQGIEIERKSRTVKIYQLKLVEWKEDNLILEVHCSKGTYIRTLVEDMGKKLGCGAHVTFLRRLKAGPYREEQMIELSAIEKLAEQEDLSLLDKNILPIDSMLQNIPVVSLSRLQTESLQRGRPLFLRDQLPGVVRLVDANQNRFLGIGEIEVGGKLLINRLIAQ